ncbi:hypothetical protein [Lysobacter sp. Root983]|uniref:hypothetical protein n=1 Tax=Lysobacter sp. Root983 TaxID=1736613 RepID=UPI00070CBC87|nr:hypothetical protein [Lysobacter sp. Root983]KRD79664.1 hypothetical protein ASE43_01795 [Lysobacter sp. Root983]
MRHLAPAFLESTLRRGATLEQFMGGSVGPLGERSVRWIELCPTQAGIEVREYHAADVGGSLSETSLDLYALCDLHDLYEAQPEPTMVADEPAQALAYAHSVLRAQPLRWVNQGVSQDELLDFLRAGRPALWPPEAAQQ